MTELFVRSWWLPDEKFLAPGVSLAARLLEARAWLCPNCYESLVRGMTTATALALAHDCVFSHRHHHQGAGLTRDEMDALRRIAHGNEAEAARFGMEREEAQALIRNGLFTPSPARLHHGTGPRRRQNLEEATT